jgi:hypothetical protein
MTINNIGLEKKRVSFKKKFMAVLAIPKWSILHGALIAMAFRSVFRGR